jgi:serine/threonine-protein kinase
MADDKTKRENPRDLDTLAIDPLKTFQPQRTEVLRSLKARSGAAGSQDPPPAQEPPPALAAPYSLERIVGRGGMGEVWEAKQESLDRPVAVKRVRKDLGSSLTLPEMKTMSRMFREEALTTAFLDHPNIVPVHDLIADVSGEPALAMKLVRGRPWHDLLREDFTRLSMTEYLARHLLVLVDVCQAVAFAHAQGIVHRDIKPSQVMVGEFGEVLLMDWGLAMSLIDRPEKRTLAFAPGKAMAPNPAGTFAFMAPEQTEDTADQLGPWTDLFLLGGTLYFVLALHPPYEASSPQGVFEAAQACQIVPPRQKQPQREIPEELSHLCLWAMQKDPALRVPSALDFLREVQEYLTGARKRKESEETTLAVATELKSGVPDYTALADFDSQLIRAEGLWPENPEAPRLRQWVIEKYARKALLAGDFLLAELQAKKLLETEARDYILGEIGLRRTEILRTRRQRTAFLGTAVVAAALLVGLGVKYTVDQKKARKEIASQRDRANSARVAAEGLITFMLGDLKKKLDPVGRLDVLEDVGAKALKYFDTLPESDRSSGALSRRVEALRQIAEIRLDQGDLKGAAALLEEGRQFARELLGREPASTEWNHLEAAVAVTQSALFRSEGKPREALLESESAVRTLERLAPGAKPPALQSTLLKAYSQQALLQRIVGDLDGALATSREAVDLSTALLGADPSNPDWLTSLASTHARMGGVHRMRGDVVSSLAEYEKCGKALERRLALDPADTRAKADLALNYSHRGAVLAGAGRMEEALVANREHLARMEELSSLEPANASWQLEVGVGHATVARVLKARGDFEGAREELCKEEAILHILLTRNLSSPEWKRGLGINLLAQASVLVAQKRAESASDLLKKAGPLVTEAAERASGDQQAQRFLGQLFLLQGRIAETRGDRDAARQWTEKAESTLAPLVERSNDTMFLVPYAQALALLGREDEARPIVETTLARGWSDKADLEFFGKHGLLGSR